MMYRGAGPGRNTFDFTPAFYEEWCEKQDLPTRLEARCEELEGVAARLDGRVNCIRHPERAECEERMAEARKFKKQRCFSTKSAAESGRQPSTATARPQSGGLSTAPTKSSATAAPTPTGCAEAPSAGHMPPRKFRGTGWPRLLLGKPVG